jgi:AcrR family transcriptional regulator
MPPLRNAAATKERLLDSARKRFLQESYEAVGLREIASDAGVDVALVGRYFGSKEQLFKDVLRKDGGNWKELALQAPDLPSFLAEIVAGKDRSGDASHVERLLIMLRSVSSPLASELVRSSFAEDVLVPLSSLLKGPNPEMRAAMAMSVLMGTTVMRTIMNLHVLHECDDETFKKRLAQLLRAALDNGEVAPIATSAVCES